MWGSRGQKQEQHDNDNDDKNESNNNNKYENKDNDGGKKHVRHHTWYVPNGTTAMSNPRVCTYSSRKVLSSIRLTSEVLP